MKVEAKFYKRDSQNIVELKKRSRPPHPANNETTLIQNISSKIEKNYPTKQKNLLAIKPYYLESIQINRFDCFVINPLLNLSAI